MAEERIPYSAVLADLENRRNALNTRISSIDAAIDGIRALLDGPPAGQFNGSASGAAPASFSPSTRSQALVPRLPAASSRGFTLPNEQGTAVARSVQNSGGRTGMPPPHSSDRRKKPGLNIYVNHYPEWSRAMSRGNLHFRKKAGVRCPKCGSPDTRESATKGVSDLLMLLFDYSNARCRSCDCRFKIWKQSGGGEFAPAPAVD